MKTPKYILISIFFSLNLFIFSETKPVVYLEKVINHSNQTWLDSLCLSISSNVYTKLSLLNKYEIVHGETDLNSLTTEDWKVFSIDNKYDSIITGSCKIGENGYEISLTAYDLLKEEVIFSDKRIIENIFESFDVVDEFTITMIEGFSGLHITYGNLSIKPDNNREKYLFFLDDVSFGNQVKEINLIPSGEHIVTIFQERLSSSEKIVEEKINIKAEKQKEYNFVFPYLMDKERDILDLNDTIITTNWSIKDNLPNIDESFLATNNFLSQDFFNSYRPELIDKYKQWKSIFEYYKAKKIYKSTSYNNLLFPLNSKLDIDIPNYLGEVSKLINFKSNLNDKYIIPNFNKITVNGNPNDWVNIPETLIDNVNDAVKIPGLEFVGGDIKNIKSAIDNKNLYLYLETEDGKFNKDYIYKFHFLGNKKMMYNIYPKNIKTELLIKNQDSGINMKPYIKAAKFDFGEILELSIPLKDLIEHTDYKKFIDMEILIDYNTSENSTKNIDKYDFKLNLPLIKILTLNNNDIKKLNNSFMLWDFNNSTEKWTSSGNITSSEKIDLTSILKLNTSSSRAILLYSPAFKTSNFIGKKLEIRFWVPNEWNSEMEIQYYTYDSSGRWNGSEVAPNRVIKKNAWNIQTYNFTSETRGSGDITKIIKVGFEFINLHKGLKNGFYIDYIRIVQ
ncbi:MAG: hypothetical protein OCD02_09575 [Spirochaetaceae bacterium]